MRVALTPCQTRQKGPPLWGCSACLSFGKHKIVKCFPSPKNTLPCVRAHVTHILVRSTQKPFPPCPKVLKHPEPCVISVANTWYFLRKSGGREQQQSLSPQHSAASHAAVLRMENQEEQSCTAENPALSPWTSLQTLDLVANTCHGHSPHNFSFQTVIFPSSPR